MLVTAEEFYNATGINLTEHFKTQSAVDNWLQSQEDNVIDYIATYAFNGMSQVQRYLGNARLREVIKKAVLRQAEFVARNGYVQYDLIAVKSEAENIVGFCPSARALLANNGLLYTGRLCD